MHQISANFSSKCTLALPVFSNWQTFLKSSIWVTSFLPYQYRTIFITSKCFFSSTIATEHSTCEDIDIDTLVNCSSRSKVRIITNWCICFNAFLLVESFFFSCLKQHRLKIVNQNAIYKRWPNPIRLVLGIRFPVLLSRRCIMAVAWFF